MVWFVAILFFSYSSIQSAVAAPKVELSETMIAAAKQTLSGSVLHREVDQGVRAQLLKLLEDREGTQKGIARCSKYADLIKTELDKHGVPAEMGQIPFVESRCQNELRNAGENGGIWSFSSFTSALYELGSEKGIDDRLDPVKETIAAGDFLDEEFRAVPNWPLVILGYRYGKAQVKTAEKQIKSADPLKVQHQLHKEAYLDQVTAAFILSKNLKVFGFGAN